MNKSEDGCEYLERTTRIMKFARGMKKHVLTLWAMVFVFPTATLMAQLDGVMPSVIVWDTMAPLGNAVDIQDRGKWQAVPADVLTLEIAPTAMSDPAYYGRAYRFKGDAVVENKHLIAAFPTNRGRVVIYSKADLAKKVELVPLQLKGKPANITNCSLLKNTGDETTLEISFSAGDAGGNLNAIFSLGRTGIVTFKPTGNMKGVSIVSSIDYGVVPSFIGDDLIFDPRRYPSLEKLYIPCENLLLGLLKGEDCMLVLTWPEGNQELSLSLENDEQKPGLIESVDFRNNGQNLYLALLNAPGIWHREELKRSYLERDIVVSWKRPFQAKWKTQLREGGIKTTFVFRESKQNIWRGGVGSYTYPVWFDGEAAVYRLGKKIPPRGESIIYFTERKGTPLSVSAPVDIMRESLGREMCEAILDVSGRELRTHHRRGAEGIRRACTCGCTEAIEEVFRAGAEVDQRRYVEGAVDDMVYFVTRHVERIEEYQDFADDVIEFLESAGKSAGELKPFIDSMAEIAKELREQYTRAREHMKTLGYADQLARKTKALTRDKEPGNLEACLELGKQWRAMGGAQDDVLAQSHRIVRKLFHEAGYRGVDNPQAAEITRQIREMCRVCLRNPDGYEIWPNY